MGLGSPVKAQWEMEKTGSRKGRGGDNSMVLDQPEEWKVGFHSFNRVKKNPTSHSLNHHIRSSTLHAICLITIIVHLLKQVLLQMNRSPALDKTQSPLWGTLACLLGRPLPGLWLLEESEGHGT
ncbi:uncharacterized protein LOC144244345 [Crocuta crocuta]